MVQLLHPSSPEQIVVFAVDCANDDDAAPGAGGTVGIIDEHERITFDSLFGDFPNDHQHSPLFAAPASAAAAASSPGPTKPGAAKAKRGGATAARPLSKRSPRGGGSGMSSLRQQQPPQVPSSPQLRRIASGSPFREAFRLD